MTRSSSRQSATLSLLMTYNHWVSPHTKPGAANEKITLNKATNRFACHRKKTNTDDGVSAIIESVERKWRTAIYG